MRIVHQMYGKNPSVSVHVKGYSGPVSEAPQWCGARCEVLICDWPETDGHHDAIEIEGDLEAIKTALRAALGSIEALEAWERQRVAKVVATSVRCDVCCTWYDAAVCGQSHADGRGGRCFGLIAEDFKHAQGADR